MLISTKKVLWRLLTADKMGIKNTLVSKKSVLAVMTVAIAFLLLARLFKAGARLWLDRVIVAIAAPVNEKTGLRYQIMQIP